MRGLRPVLTAVALGLLVGAAPARAKDDDFAAAAQAFRAAVSTESKKALSVRAVARESLARTKDPRAIPLLSDDYRQKAWADGPDRFLIASIAGRLCRGSAALAPAYAAWRARCATATDAWLWYRALLVEDEFAPGIAGSVALDAALAPALRAAALRVLEERTSKGAFEVVDGVATSLPLEPAGRGLLVEATASFVAATRTHVREPAYRRVLEHVLRTLDDASTGDRVRDFVARRLAVVFGTDVLATNASAPWMREFLASGLPVPAGPAVPAAPGAPVEPPTPPTGPEAPRPPDGPERYAGPTVFFGIAAVGTRVAYVIDGSGSMSAPLTVDEHADLRARTGEDVGPKRKGKTVDPAADAAGIDWRRVRTRFDAAREFLKASLRRQLRDAEKERDRAKARGAVTGDPAAAPTPSVAPPPPRSFTIVVFSSAARSLRATPGMMPVTRANVEAAIDDLDAEGPGGMTNIYGGLRRAFSTGAKDGAAPEAYAELDAIHAGCDVLFLLSDGGPTADDWGVGSGVYVEEDNIVEDVLRWNLLRRAEIHCVGVGEAPADLLGRIAGAGGGRVVALGKKKR